VRFLLGCQRERKPVFCLTRQVRVNETFRCPNFLTQKEVSVLPSVELRPNESQEQLLRRFRRKVAKSGVLSTVRRKRWFVSKSELRRIQKKKAIRRSRRRTSKSRRR